MSKLKINKVEWRTIKAIVGSVVITPKEIESFKKHGIDLIVALKKIQKEVYKRPKKIIKKDNERTRK